jgi:hypothetical protein
MMMSGGGGVGYINATSTRDCMFRAAFTSECG